MTLTVDSHPMVHIASRIAVAKKPRTTWGQKGARGTREGNGGKRIRAHIHAHSLVHITATPIWKSVFSTVE